MKKLLWWLRRCRDCWDETIELVDGDELRCLEEDAEWDAGWRSIIFGDVIDAPETDVFPGIDEFLTKPCELTDEEEALGLTEYIQGLRK